MEIHSDDNTKNGSSGEQRKHALQSIVPPIHDAQLVSENPSPVVRFSHNLQLLYANLAAKNHFLNDFSIDVDRINDIEFQEIIEFSCQQTEVTSENILGRNGRYYSVRITNDIENKLVTVYAFEITTLVVDVQKKEKRLIEVIKQNNEQRNFYEGILHHLPSDIAVFDLHHNYIFVNTKAIQNNEIREFMIGKNDFDYCRLKNIPTQLAEDRRALFNTVFETMRQVTWEDDIIDAAGNRKVILRFMSPLLNDKQELQAMVGYGLDITGRKIAEEELIAANFRLELMESFLDLSSDAIQVSTESGQLVYINKCASERLGIDPEKVTDYHVKDFDPRFIETAAWVAHVEELKEKGSLLIESTNKHQFNGETIHVEVRIKLEKINGCFYVIATSRDITERKIAKEKENERTAAFIRQQIALITLSKFPNEYDFTKKLQQIAQTSAEIVNGDFACVYLYKDHKKFLYAESVYDAKKKSSVTGNTIKRSDYTDFFDTLERTKDDLFFDNTSESEPITFPTDSKLNSTSSFKQVFVPLRIGEQQFGFLSFVFFKENKIWNDKEIYFVRSIADLIALNYENNRRLEIEKIVHSKSIFQKLLMEISTKYINLPIEKVKPSIQQSLQDIGKFVEVDRVYVFDYNHQTASCSNLYEWCNTGIEPQIDFLQNVPMENMQEWYAVHKLGDEIWIPSIQELPEGELKTLLSDQGILSLLALPMMDEDTCIGFVGFDSVFQYRSFNEEEKILLRLFAQMLVNVEKRTQYIQQIEQKKTEIEHINTNLEKLVEEELQKNLALVKSLSDQEKLVTIGEIASGVAHDLNTPLGAIKSGADNLLFSLDKFLRETISNCTDEQVQFALNRAKEKSIELFVGGIQLRQETHEMQLILNSITATRNKNWTKEEWHELAKLFVKARIDKSDSTLIHRVLDSENPKDFLYLMYYLQTHRTLLHTIITSSNRAAQVIHDLKSYIQEKKHSDKTTVNLLDNINTVLNIFNFELKRIENLQVHVSAAHHIKGIDVKLYQLWSNILKNALESFLEIGIKGSISIESKETDKHIFISIENNGKKIPEEVQQQMFQKFYTTKSATTGTGLGLSIVRNILDEHNASIQVESNEKSTKFTIAFNK